MSEGKVIKKWVLRYIKYNIIGLTVFLINIIIYVVIFPFFGEWAYIIVSIDGGVMEFALITYVNRTKRGIIFDSCKQTDGKTNEKGQPPCAEQLPDSKIQLNQ